MSDIKTAVTNAKAFAAETLGIDEFLLEEVTSDPQAFHITLSFPRRIPGSLSNPMVAMRAFEQREYKSFDVDKITGDVVGMAIRKL